MTDLIPDEPMVSIPVGLNPYTGEWFDPFPAEELPIDFDELFELTE